MTMIKIEKNFKKHKNHSPLCSACDEKAYRKVEIQHDIFRGNDDVFFLCERHTSLVRTNIDEFYKDIKAEKIKRKVEHETTITHVLDMNCPKCGWPETAVTRDKTTGKPMSVRCTKRSRGVLQCDFKATREYLNEYFT